VTVPWRVPEAPRGELCTAAKASSLPSPQTLLSSAVPPHWSSATSTALSSSSCLVVATSPISEGAADHISATVPLTCGVAIDVPLKDA
jgi:hypothetical protein